MSIKNGSKSLIIQGQIKAGRALLGWSQHDLSTYSGVSLNTIKRIEQGEGRIKARLRTIEDLMEAFLNHGIRFENEPNRVGVALLLDVQARTVAE